MSINEKNLTPNERELLKSLNVKANLILEFEELMQRLKLPYDKTYIYSLDEEVLRNFINSWTPENQEEMREKFLNETKNQK
jgi:hypothetical protein